MQAVVITEPGAPDVLRVRSHPDPVPGAGEVLVRVAATSVNRADLLQRRGLYPAPPGAPAGIPGLEFAGVVEGLGAGVDGWGVGDRVMGLAAGGAYAELIAVPGAEAVRVPDGMPLEVAAAVPEVFITAHDALRTRLGVSAGETLLIHAVGSGVGTAAVQLAREWGLRTLGTSRTAWKLDRAASLGLDVALHVAGGEFADDVLEATDGAGVDAILDLVGGGYLRDNLRSLATLGRQVVVGLVSGRSAELDMGMLLRKRVTIVGTVLRSRPPAEKAAATAAFARDVVPLLAEGRVAPVIHDTLPMAEAAAAHGLVESNETFGSVVLSW